MVTVVASVNQQIFVWHCKDNLDLALLRLESGLRYSVREACVSRLVFTPKRVQSRTAEP